MEKREKLEQINRLVQKLGLLFQKVKEAFSAKILPGMYVYADGSISAKLIAGCQVKAIVGYVKGKTVYAVCLKRNKLPWSSNWLGAKATQNMTDGKEATRNILNEARKTGKQAEAAQWCYDYAEDGVKQGEAFLPSLTELEKLFANGAAINASLKALGAALLDGWYWSSNEGDNYSAWGFDMNFGYSLYLTKIHNYHYVMPVLAIQI